MGKKVRVRIIVKRLFIWASKKAFKRVNVMPIMFDNSELGIINASMPLIMFVLCTTGDAKRVPK